MPETAISQPPSSPLKKVIGVGTLGGVPVALLIWIFTSFTEIEQRISEKDAIIAAQTVKIASMDNRLHEVEHNIARLTDFVWESGSSFLGIGTRPDGLEKFHGEQSSILKE